MSIHSIYADYNANAPLRDCALKEILACYKIAGNPSSIHKNGQKLRKIIENSRKEINNILGNISGETIFTSGATESAQLAIESALHMGFENVFLSAIEHDALYQYCKVKFENIKIIPCLKSGEIDIDWLENKIQNIDKPLVILMAANNETGIIQPIKKASNLARNKGGAIIVDAVQVFGKINPQEYMGYSDYLIISGHKIGAPIGIGALIFAAGISPSLERAGGGQEKGIRSGSLNAASICAFAASIKAIDEEENLRIKEIRDIFEKKLKTEFADLTIFGENSPRINNTSCFAIHGKLAEHIVIALDLEGICISSGSACSSGSTKISRTIKAICNDDNIAKCAVRISFGYASSINEVDIIINALKKAVNFTQVAS